ncbi:MAG: tetratricopeptide repeat protein [Phycisphaerales bacterium]|nr:MAG: tetratricopeptide repeat protein [Phycisphaerales bacterium]
MDVTHNNADQGHDPTGEYERLQELADCYISTGDYSQAQLCYEKAANLAPDEPVPYLGLGVVALQEGSLDDAEIAFRVACRLDPGCARAYAGLGMVWQQKGDYRQAFDMYLKCLEHDTDNLIALLGLFQSSCQMGSFAKVIQYLEVYLSMHPGDTSVMFPLAALYMKEGSLEKSRKIVCELLMLDPGHEDAINLLEELDHYLAEKAQKIASPAQCAGQVATGVQG